MNVKRFCFPEIGMYSQHHVRKRMWSLLLMRVDPCLLKNLSYSKFIGCIGIYTVIMSVFNNILCYVVHTWSDGLSVSSTVIAASLAITTLKVVFGFLSSDSGTLCYKFYYYIYIYFR
jgi:hypothetical protein